MTVSTADVTLAAHQFPWWVPLLEVSLVAAAFAYVAGIGATRLLGAKVASFVGLTEVLFAILFAWLLLGQLPTGIQLVGGLLVVAGVALVRLDEMRGPAAVVLNAVRAVSRSPGGQGLRQCVVVVDHGVRGGCDPQVAGTVDRHGRHLDPVSGGELLVEGIGVR